MAGGAMLWANRMFRRLRALVPKREGSAGVEFAFALPIILVAILGVMEGGRLIYTQTALHFAAQEATRFAVVRDGEVTDQEVADFAAGRLIGIDTVSSEINVESQGSSVGGCEYTVSLLHEITPMIPYTGSRTITLSARSSGFVAFDSSPGSSSCGS